jgi:hypothetical protein
MTTLERLEKAVDRIESDLTLKSDYTNETEALDMIMGDLPVVRYLGGNPAKINSLKERINRIKKWMKEEAENTSPAVSYATFGEYEAAKLEIIFGVEYTEETQFPNSSGMASKQYSTERNGTFFQVANPNTGVTEFWSTKSPKSRYFYSERLKR